MYIYIRACIRLFNMSVMVLLVAITQGCDSACDTLSTSQELEIELIRYTNIRCLIKCT